MTAKEFLEKHYQLPSQIDGAACLGALCLDADAGLGGEGGLPMIPAFLTADGSVPEEGVCAVMDAGGTNLRTGLARFRSGSCTIEDIRTIPMPASGGEELTAAELYGRIAGELARLEDTGRIGCCFSYLVDIERTLDGRLREWCKEIRCPDAVGAYVGSSIAEKLPDCNTVAVLNDTAAAFLGAKQRLCHKGRGLVGLIMGTGVNVCYAEQRQNIPKLAPDICCDDMIINTEVCEFARIPLGDFEQRVILATNDQAASRAEKQCSGAYLGDIILEALRVAKDEGLIGKCPQALDLATVSDLLEKENSTHRVLFDEEDIPFALELLDLAVDRAAKIGAILTAEFVRRAAISAPEVVIVAEGSLFWKMYRFRDRFARELAQLIPGISFRIERVEGACLEGAAVAAFARGM